MDCGGGGGGGGITPVIIIAWQVKRLHGTCTIQEPMAYYVYSLVPRHSPLLGKA